MYSALAIGFLARWSVLAVLPEALPRFLVPVLLSIVGPAALFAWGIQAWPTLMAVLALMATFLSLARLAWLRSPDTEWFAVWIICAVVVWAGCGWLLAASSI